MCSQWELNDKQDVYIRIKIPTHFHNTVQSFQLNITMKQTYKNMAYFLHWSTNALWAAMNLCIKTLPANNTAGDLRNVSITHLLPSRTIYPQDRPKNIYIYFYDIFYYSWNTTPDCVTFSIWFKFLNLFPSSLQPQHQKIQDVVASIKENAFLSIITKSCSWNIYNTVLYCPLPCTEIKYIICLQCATTHNIHKW